MGVEWVGRKLVHDKGGPVPHIWLLLLLLLLGLGAGADNPPGLVDSPGDHPMPLAEIPPNICHSAGPRTWDECRSISPIVREA